MLVGVTALRIGKYMQHRHNHDKLFFFIRGARPTPRKLKEFYSTNLTKPAGDDWAKLTAHCKIKRFCTKFLPLFISPTKGLATLKGLLKLKVPIFRCPKMGLRAAESKNRTETTFSRQNPPKMVDLTFVSCVYHFWMRNKQILNFAYFYLIFP